jgi:hypothetical protein
VEQAGTREISSQAYDTSAKPALQVKTGLPMRWISSLAYTTNMAIVTPTEVEEAAGRNIVHRKELDKIFADSMTRIKSPP